MKYVHKKKKEQKENTRRGPADRGGAPRRVLLGHLADMFVTYICVYIYIYIYIMYLDV